MFAVRRVQGTFENALEAAGACGTTARGLLRLCPPFLLISLPHKYSSLCIQPPRLTNDYAAGYSSFRRGRTAFDSWPIILGTPEVTAPLSCIVIAYLIPLSMQDHLFVPFLYGIRVSGPPKYAGPFVCPFPVWYSSIWSP